MKIQLQQLLPISICVILIILIVYHQLTENFYEDVKVVHHGKNASVLYSAARSLPTKAQITGFESNESNHKDKYKIATECDPVDNTTSPHSCKDKIKTIQKTAESKEQLHKIKITDKQKKNMVESKAGFPNTSNNNTNNSSNPGTVDKLRKRIERLKNKILEIKKKRNIE